MHYIDYIYACTSYYSKIIYDSRAYTCIHIAVSQTSLRKHFKPTRILSKSTRQ